MPDSNPTGIVDAWMQHPTGTFLSHPMFAPLRRISTGNARRVFGLA